MKLRLALIASFLTLTLAVVFGQRGLDRDVIPEGSRVQYRQFHSQVLDREIPYGLYLPPSYDEGDRRYPLLIFLHGANENERRWSTRGLTDLMLDRMAAEGEIGEFIVAIPYGANSFYTNSVTGERWEDMILDEFIPMIESGTRAIGTREARGVSGTSMGGYGALKLALGHPELFGSVSAHSAMLLEDFDSATVNPVRAQLYSALFDRIFGISESLDHWNANDPLRMAREADNLEGLRIYFDCGLQDEYGFFEGAQLMHEILEARGVEHEFHLYPGPHGWDYVRQHTAASLGFHWEAFRGE